MIEDERKLIDFFDRQSEKPGVDNVFADLFVKMDELVEDEGEGAMAEAFLHPEAFGEGLDDEDVTSVLEMDEDDRFANFTPFIKLHADPHEVYLQMMASGGIAEEEELRELESVREARIQRVKALPDHAWIIEPILPDIIKEFIVSYVVNDRDITRFTKLARSNSILGLSDFLPRALEDWKDKAIFQRMAVTPPDEMLNYFEYYISLLIGIDNIEDIRTVEQVLIDSDPCFPKYEMELWRRISIVVNDRKDIDRLFDSASRFIDYLISLEGLIKIRDEAADIIQEYFVGLHNSGKIEKYSAFLQHCNELKEDNQRIGEVLCENYAYLVNAKLYIDRNADVRTEWIKTIELLQRYENPLEMCKSAMKTAHDYMVTLVQRDELDLLRELTKAVEGVYENQCIAEIADIVALCNANIYSIYYEKNKKLLTDEYERVRKIFADFPNSMHVRAAVLAVWRIAYLDSSTYRKVPDKVIGEARTWAKSYPTEIEFPEGYFGLLLARLEYAQEHDQRNEQRRLFREMKSIAERTDYSEYNEENKLLASIKTLQQVYGYQ